MHQNANHIGGFPFKGEGRRYGNSEDQSRKMWTAATEFMLRPVISLRELGQLYERPAFVCIFGESFAQCSKLICEVCTNKTSINLWNLSINKTVKRLFSLTWSSPVEKTPRCWPLSRARNVVDSTAWGLAQKAMRRCGDAAMSCPMGVQKAWTMYSKIYLYQWL